MEWCEGSLSVHYRDKPAVPPKQLNLAVVCDFDGTITINDTLQHVLTKFGTMEWKKIEEQYEKGEISLQDCLRRQGALVKTPEMVLIAELERVTSFRPNFGKLVAYCRANRVPLAVVSAGLDFTIKHLLRMKGWDNLVKLYSAKATSTPDGIKFTFPRLQDKSSLSIKDDIVKRYKKKGARVAYAGDGIRDLQAIREADYRYVIKGSKLATVCRQQGIIAREVTDFQEITNAIQFDLT